MADPKLKAALSGPGCITAPGVYDLVSAIAADKAGFPALYMSGFSVIASSLGLPDAGIATYRDMHDRVAQICARTRTPLIADADTGYGGLLNVKATVEGYEKAGALAIQIEDQIFPKKCGHTPDRQVIPLPEMLRKIEVAVDTRASDDFLVIARTDARTKYGLDEAIARGRALAQAGADVVFVESPQSVEELKRIGGEIDATLLVNVVHGGQTPVLPLEDYAAMGFSVAIYPVTGLLAAARAATSVYEGLKGNGILPQSVELMEFDDFNRLIGFEEVWEFDRRWA